MNFFTEEQNRKFMNVRITRKKRNQTIENEENKIVVGLDIGTTKIATVVGTQAEDGKINVLSYGKGQSTGVQHGLIVNIIKTIEGINSAVKAAANRYEHDFDEVYVGVAGRHIKSVEYRHVVTRRNGKNEIIRQDEMDEIIDVLKNISVNPGETIIDVIPQRFIIDTYRETIDPVGELGEVMEGYYQIITGNHEEINKIIKCVLSAKLKAKAIILEPIASGLSCLTHEEKMQGVALVDIGGGTTDVAIFHNGKPVFTRVIPVGGAVITNDIATVCRITEEMAEKLKQTHGTCIIDKSNKNNFITIPNPIGIPPIQISETYLAQIINARVQRGILNEVKKALDESGYYDKLKRGVVLTGGGSSLKDMKELFVYMLNLPVRIGLPEVGFVPSLYPELKSPLYATGLGLLKYGINGLNKCVSKDVNGNYFDPYIPSEQEKQDKQDRQNKPNEPVKSSFFEDFLKSVNTFFKEMLKETV